MVIIESFLPGTEVTCGVYRTKNGLVALPLTEIVSENEFFDYEAKYMGKSQEITPARISASSTELIQQKAQEIYSLLNLKSVARIDFMLVDETPYVIEVNTTPGFSTESIVPKMLQEAQLPITLFWHQILCTEL
jgi:D-alanine-D-alanine ligase